MKRGFSLIALAMVVFLVAGVDANASGDVAQIEEHGLIHTSSGISITTFVVTIGTPRFDMERAGLASIFGAYLANAQFFISIPGKGWVVQEWRLPEEEDFNELFPNNLIAQKPTHEEFMPAWFHMLPPRLKDNIESFLAFYSGAFRIFLSDQAQDKAEELARAINAAKYSF